MQLNMIFLLLYLAAGSRGQIRLRSDPFDKTKHLQKRKNKTGMNCYWVLHFTDSRGTVVPSWVCLLWSWLHPALRYQSEVLTASAHTLLLALKAHWAKHFLWREKSDSYLSFRQKLPWPTELGVSSPVYSLTTHLRSFMGWRRDILSSSTQIHQPLPHSFPKYSSQSYWGKHIDFKV